MPIGTGFAGSVVGTVFKASVQDVSPALRCRVVSPVIPYKQYKQQQQQQRQYKQQEQQHDG